jgi:pilus assembly protein Flp/PilA
LLFSAGATENRMFTKFFKDESGATAIEYAMVAGGIALGLVALIPKIGSSVKSMLAGVLTGG